MPRLIPPLAANSFGFWPGGWERPL